MAKQAYRIIPVIIALMTLIQHLPPAASVIVPSQGLKSITEGLVKVKSGDTLWVEPGIYREHISIMSGVTVISRQLHKAIIDGAGRGEVVTISHNATISGFAIHGGNVGVLSRGPGTAVIQCKIYQNRSSGIMCMGSMAVLENNIVVYNDGSGIQALDIASGCTTINHNTIAFNGNNGIIYNGTNTLTIENNIISHNNGQGIKTSEEKLLSVKCNVFFANNQTGVTLSEDNFTVDPLYTDPKRKVLDFSLRSDSKAIKQANDSKNIGAVTQ